MADCHADRGRRWFLQRKVEAGNYARGNVNLKGQRRPPQWFPEVLIDDDDIGNRVVHLHDLKRILGLIGGHDWTKAICCSLGAVSGFDQVFPLPGIDPK
ncbi:hypothetical protein [Novosphingobium resinovorum]|uniref:hypothetical protein n=1 Tax=Novosphingobium resinovorum TaxID=158500 RepID=UPI002ED2C74E|nr:hypothetical protein [Novosphingobium resinovorum]